VDKKKKKIRPCYSYLRKKDPKFVATVIEQRFSDFIVKHGIFKGMQYIKTRALWSQLFPKLLGSYERELYPLLKSLLDRDYSDIINIGCGEGYYTVGFALKFPKTKIYAFDINLQALSSCRKMCKANALEESRFAFKRNCSPEILMNLPLGNRALIFMDCEGYEKELIEKYLPEKMKNHDFLIEVHDCMDITISDYLKVAFDKTHNLKSVKSVDDVYKAKNYDYPELEGFNLMEKFYLLAEYRMRCMDWYYFSPRQTKNIS
jgi:precorrin-6B methylase 2